MALLLPFSFSRKKSSHILWESEVAFFFCQSVAKLQPSREERSGISRPIASKNPFPRHTTDSPMIDSLQRRAIGRTGKNRRISAIPPLFLRSLILLVGSGDVPRAVKKEGEEKKAGREGDIATDDSSSDVSSD